MCADVSGAAQSCAAIELHEMQLSVSREVEDIGGQGTLASSDADASVFNTHAPLHTHDP